VTHEADPLSPQEPWAAIPLAPDAPEVPGTPEPPVGSIAPVTPEVVPSAGPGVFDLVVRSARLGVDAANLVAGEVADFSVRVARAVLPPAVAGGPLDAVDERLGRQRTAARERGEHSVEQTKEAAEAVLNQVVIGVVDMLDMEQLIDHVPIDKVVARVDVAGVINEVDLGGIVRESTTGLVGETIDAVRVQVMGLDLFATRIVDKILRRKQPRALLLEGYDVAGPEIRVPKEMR
jgi:hypothetical protein